MSKHHTHVLDIYNVHLHAVTTRKAWAKLRKDMPHLDENPGLGHTHLFEWIPNDGTLPERHVALYIDVKAHRDDHAELINTCAHEATHAAGMILDQIKARYDGNSEPFAYLVGWLTAWLWNLT